jgi:hypothetical protein
MSLLHDTCCFPKVTVSECGNTTGSNRGRAHVQQTCRIKLLLLRLLRVCARKLLRLCA